MLDALLKAREEQAYFSSIVYQTEAEVHLSDSAKMRVSSVSPDMARQEMQKRERMIEQLLEQIQLHTAADLKYRPHADWSSSAVTSLYSMLEPTTIMVEYYLAEQDLYIFQSTQQGVTVQRFPGVLPMLERLLSLWRTNLDLSGRAASAVDQAQTFAGLLENSLGLLQRLYAILLRPLEELLPTCEHLIIVPYGILHYLPFHCLYDGTSFLIERVQLSYLPAASLLPICRQRGQRVQSQPHGMGDALVMGLADSGRLQYAVHEAETVSQQLGVTCVLNKKATSTLLSQRSPFCSLVHIAAHGLFRLDAPNFSYIQLADRQFSTIEAFNLDLSLCSLIVLSACETGRAVVGGVDEVIGLGRGFIYAGAASILPTLWKVDDASSAELMEIFYHSLLNGAHKSAALAYAQRVFIARARESRQTYRLHPYFWAAFQLIGDAGSLFQV
jgi:CHAT domain-containing protein